MLLRMRLWCVKFLFQIGSIRGMVARMARPQAEVSIPDWFD